MRVFNVQSAAHMHVVSAEVSQSYSPESVSLPAGENNCVLLFGYICWASMMSRYLASIILGSRLVLNEA